MILNPPFKAPGERGCGRGNRTGLTDGGVGRVPPESAGDASPVHVVLPVKGTSPGRAGCTPHTSSEAVTHRTEVTPQSWGSGAALLISPVAEVETGPQRCNLPRSAQGWELSKERLSPEGW